MCSVTDNTGTLAMTVGSVIVYAAKNICTVSEDGTNVSVRYSPTQEFVYPATAFTSPSGDAPTIAAAIAAMITSNGGSGAATVTATEGITAAGATQGTATALSTTYNYVDTVAVNTGVIIPAATTNKFMMSIENNGANALKVYPPVGGSFNGLGVNASISVDVGGVLTIVTATIGNPIRYN